MAMGKFQREFRIQWYQVVWATAIGQKPLNMSGRLQMNLTDKLLL